MNEQLGENGIPWGKVGEFAWDNKDWVIARLKELRDWLFASTKKESLGGILIVGPGGVGKSTLAQMLSGQYNSLLDIPGSYQESIGLERYLLNDDQTVELIVPPGQRHRRDATWKDLENTISAGGYRGIVVLAAYGYHSLGEISYKHHRLYKNDDAAFLSAFLKECQADEINVLRRLSPHIRNNKRKSWILTVVTKQDLWWLDRKAVESHYRDGEYGALINEIIQDVGKNNLRHEFTFSSLVISNFTTGYGELLANTVAGYDHNLQVKSLRHLWETVYALKNWEEQL